MNSSFEDLIAYHLADSALPTGSFAYSSGLEAILEFGMVKTEEELLEYITDFVKQSIAFDFPFFATIYAHELIEPSESFREMVENYDASFISSSMYTASINQGKNWIRLLGEVFSKVEETQCICSVFRKMNLPLHYLFACGLSFRSLHLTHKKLQLFHVNNIIRDQISAAIRLGAIGSIHGHKLQFTIYTNIASLLHLYEYDSYHQARKSGYIPELAQMLHRNVYSKLFKN